MQKIGFSRLFYHRPPFAGKDTPCTILLTLGHMNSEGYCIVVCVCVCVCVCVFVCVRVCVLVFSHHVYLDPKIIGIYAFKATKKTPFITHFC